MEYLLAVSKNLAHPLHPVYDDGKGGGVQWWVKQCKSTCVRTQVARMGADAETSEEFWMKYGHPELLDYESLFQFFFWMKHTPPVESGAFMSHTECSEVARWQSVARVCEYRNHVVQEIRWADKLNPFNHCSHFPFFMTHFTHSMPISSIGGIWSANLWNPKYAPHVYKVTVAVDMLGNIIWILAPETSADVLIWDGYGPSRTRGDFFDFEVGGHDGAYKGRIHVIVPFIGRKNGTLTARQQSINDVHGWYRARIEQLFARLWHWGLVRNIWRGGPNELY